MARNRHRNRNRKKDKAMAMRPMRPEDERMGVGAAGTAPMLPGKPTMGAGMEAATPAPEKESEESGEPEPNVSPEEQELFDTVLERYFSGMYVKGKNPTPDGEPPLLEQVHNFFKDAQSEDNPISFVDVLGNVTAKTVMVLEDRMEAEGVKIPGDVLMHAGMRILNDLSEFSDSAGYHEYTDQEKAGAASQAFSIYGEERKQEGKLDVGAIQSDYEALKAADEQGTLDEILPGSAQAAEKLKPPEESEDAPTGVAAAAQQQQPLPPRTA